MQIIGEEETENSPFSINERSDNQTCAICSKSIYFLEKLSVADTFYHRSCYRENQLTNLKSRNKTLERPSKPITDQLNESNTTEDNHITKPTTDRSSRSHLSSLKAPSIVKKPTRPPSLDKYLSEKPSSKENHKKSVGNQSEDQSPQSISSVNQISINASSTESLSQKMFGVPRVSIEGSQLYSNTQNRSSLDNSTSSLNSSLNKKRHAPAPPPPPMHLRPSLLEPKSKPSRPNSHDNQEILYPEELNPFAEKDEATSVTEAISINHDDMNPFAEFMTEDIPKPAEKPKPAVKPRKRLAPKLPVNLPVGITSQSTESIFETDLTKENRDPFSIPSSNVINPEIMEHGAGESGSQDKLQIHEERRRSGTGIDNKNESGGDTKIVLDNKKTTDDVSGKVQMESTETAPSERYIALDNISQTDDVGGEVEMESAKIAPSESDRALHKNNTMDDDLGKVQMQSNEASPSKSDDNSEDAKTESILSSPAKSENRFEETKTDSILSSPEKSVDSHADSFVEDPNLSPTKVITERLNNISIDSDNQTSLSPNHTFSHPEKKIRKKKLENLCKSQDSLNDSISRKSYILKPPAPARPPPPKREVRADTSYEFIPYEFLYAQLKELNEKQTEIEAEGRKLQDILWEGVGELLSVLSQ